MPQSVCQASKSFTWVPNLALNSRTNAERKSCHAVSPAASPRFHPRFSRRRWNCNPEGAAGSKSKSLKDVKKVSMGCACPNFLRAAFAVRKRDSLPMTGLDSEREGTVSTCLVVVTGLS